MAMTVSKPACFICDIQDCPHLPSHDDLRIANEIGPPLTNEEFRWRHPSPTEYHSYFYDACTPCDDSAARGAPDRPLCLSCQHRRIQHFFICTRNYSDRALKLLLGTYQQVQDGYRVACEFCTLICKSLQVKRVMASYLLDIGTELDADSQAWLVRGKGRNNNKVLVEWRRKSNTHSFFRVSLAVATRPTGPWFMHRSKSLKEGEMRAAGTEIQWEIVRKWLSVCDTQHPLEAPSITQPIAYGDLPRGFMVIDVKAGCIVDAPPNCSYVALSYVWGVFRAGEISAKLVTLADLRIPGSLRRDTLPATIWDALTVCEEIGVHYLWVDRLCIIQDSGAQKIEQIRSMDVIYSRAVLTICALGSSDSHSGLWGTAGTPRTLVQGRAKIGPLEIVEQLDDDRLWRLGHKWWRRAWTYQEYLLSGTKLLFSPWNVTFECVHCVEAEGLADISMFTPESDIRGSGKTALEKYIDIVQEYNDREFTFPDDIYDAFKGVFKLLYGSLDQFVWGLPAVDFDKALVWSTESLDPWYDEFNEPSWRGTPRIPKRGVHLASWSWVSTSGRTAFDTNLPGHFSSVARWYHWDNDRGLRLVVNDGLTWDEKKDPSIHAWAAWHMGCIETPMPADLRDLTSLIYLREKVSQKWPTYQDYWREAFSGPAPEFTPKELALVKETTGRLLVRTTLASLQIEYSKSWPHWAIKDTFGNRVGYVFDNTTPRTFSERFSGRNYDFVAFSIASNTPSLDNPQEDGSLGQACDFKPLPRHQE